MKTIERKKYTSINRTNKSTNPANMNDIPPVGVVAVCLIFREIVS